MDIRCFECLLFGSPAVEQLKLNDRVHFDVRTTFTQQHGMPCIHAVPCCPALHFRCGEPICAFADPPAIVSASHIDVAVDPPVPFSFLPDSILQAVGGAGVHASLSTLQVCLTCSPVSLQISRVLSGWILE